MSVKQIFNTSAELDYPKVLPTLDLDFANSKTLDPRITFTRASGGSYVGADGLIKYAGVNEPRFDHDPYTGESLGFLVEEVRTNIRIYSISFDAGVSGALYGNWNYANILSYTAAIAPDGTLTANRFRPITPTGTLMQRFSATAGLTYTISMYLKLDPESPSNANVFYFGFYVAWSNNGSTLTGHAPSPSIGDQLTNEWKRFSFSYTLPAGAISMEMGPSSRSYGGVDPNYSVLAWGWQIEEGAFPTSYIPTEGSTRTRAAESASITGKNFRDFYNQSASTFYLESTLSPAIAAKKYFTLYDTNTGSELIEIATQEVGKVNIFTYNSSTTQSDVRVISSTNVFKSAVGIVANNVNISVNGTLGTADTSATQSSGINILYLGTYTNGTSVCNCPIKQLTYYPKRLPDAQLQALTT